MEVAFFGTPSHAVPSLLALAAAEFQIGAVITQPQRGRRRGRESDRSAVAIAAEELGLTSMTPQRVADLTGHFDASSIRIAAVVAYGQILPRSMIDAFDLGVVNLHFSLLPRWRGAAPVQRAILAGDEVTGVTTMLIDEGLDTGPTLGSRRVAIDSDETAGELTERLGLAGPELLLESMRDVVGGNARPLPQRAEGATYAEKLTAAECAVDWTMPASVISRLVRAASPRPIAHTEFRGRRLLISSVVALDLETAGGIGETADGIRARASGAGSILPGEERLLVATGDGLLEVLKIQPEGRRPMTGREFARGARFVDGERLGNLPKGAAGRA